MLFAQVKFVAEEPHQRGEMEGLSIGIACADRVFP